MRTRRSTVGEILNRVLIAAGLLIHAVRALAAEPAIQYVASLPPELGTAWDVRWTAERRLVVALAEKGIAEITTDFSKLTVVARTTQPMFARLAVSDDFMIGAAPFGLVGWVRRSDPRRIVGTDQFAAVVDIDGWGNRLLLLGARRDERGRWSPDDAIAFLGEFSENGVKWRPVHFSTTRNAMSMAYCEFLELGAVRFLRDGRFIIVPGAEPGVFLYSREGRLLRTWDTEGLGFVDRCSLNESERRSLGKDAVARFAWLNLRTTIDDVVVLDGKPALILRSVQQGRARWEILTLSEDGRYERVPLPQLAISDSTHLRADIRSGVLAVVLMEYGWWGGKAPPLGRIAFVRLR